MRNIATSLLLVSLISQTVRAEEQPAKSWRDKATDLYSDYVKPNKEYVVGGVIAFGVAILGAKVLLPSASNAQVQQPMPDLRASRPHIPQGVRRSDSHTRPQDPPSSMSRFDLSGALATDAFLSNFEPFFAKIGALAVFDAGTYRHMIKDPASLLRVLARANAPVFNPVVNGARSRSQSMANALHSQAKQNLTNEEALRIAKLMHQIRRDVELGRGGICTTFAFAAADVMLDEARQSDVRIEIVAHRGHGADLGTHVFVLVGRPIRSNLEDPRTWGRHVRIVDLWLRALLDGAFNGILTVDQFGNMLSRLEVVFDSSILTLNE